MAGSHLLAHKRDSSTLCGEKATAFSEKATSRRTKSTLEQPRAERFGPFKISPVPSQNRMAQGEKPVLAALLTANHITRVLASGQLSPEILAPPVELADRLRGHVPREVGPPDQAVLVAMLPLQDGLWKPEQVHEGTAHRLPRGLGASPSERGHQLGPLSMSPMTEAAYLAHEPRQPKERFRGARTEHSVSHAKGPSEAPYREDFRERSYQRNRVELASILNIRELMPVAPNTRRRHAESAPRGPRSSPHGKGARSDADPRCRTHGNIDERGHLDYRQAVEKEGGLAAEDSPGARPGVGRDSRMKSLARSGLEPS